MAVVRKHQKMRRMQISITDAQYQRAKRLAEKQGISVSEVFRDGLECFAERVEQDDREYFDRMWQLVGFIKDADPLGSERVDDIVYGPDINR